jgi:hypothetical protein
MTARRIDAGPLIALIGALALLVSLFLDWYRPHITAWEVFEIEDLVLAAVAVVTILAAAALAGVRVPEVPAAWLGWAAGIALVLVVAALLNHPPAALGADPQEGLWIALAGAVLMAAGALLSLAQVHIRVDVEGRRRRRVHADDPTTPMPPTDPGRPGGV